MYTTLYTTRESRVDTSLEIQEIIEDNHFTSVREAVIDLTLRSPILFLNIEVIHVSIIVAAQNTS